MLKKSFKLFFILTVLFSFLRIVNSKSSFVYAQAACSTAGATCCKDTSNKYFCNNGLNPTSQTALCTCSGSTPSTQTPTQNSSTPVTQSHANGDKIGPELADPAAGANVVDRNGFKGTVAVINSIGGSVQNTVPSKSSNPVALRLLMDSGTTIDSMILYANLLNGSGPSQFPNGAIIILGNELNNLKGEWKDTNFTLRDAGARYAFMFNSFADNVTLDRGKFKVAPAPPDMYNGDFDPVEWLNGFLYGDEKHRYSYGVDCDRIDTLIANVFQVQPAAKVGGQWDQTYIFLQNYIGKKCPGKTVTHFEGWGADPHASVSDQVNFLNTQPLPVNSAATLIVDNCDGSFGGNGIKPWLYYIPKAPFVYKADGTPLDPQTCSGSSNLATTKNPYTPKDVPCDSRIGEYSDEYHSLRPYPASPCKKEVSETALMCGNDLIVKKTFSDLAPSGDCTSPGADGSFFCNYKYSGLTDNVTINLKNAELPILGNTELVPNSTDRNGAKRAYITYGQRVNEYVSWYLNGAIDRAEENFIKIPSDIDTLLNYSGPLRKLFPWSVQINQGMKTVQQVFDTRHDQTVGCYSNGQPVSCATPEALKDTQEVRASFWKNASPPLESAFSDFREYWKAYMTWRGQFCTPSLLGFFLCSPDLTAGPNWLASFFPFIPQSSTEDRTGQVITDNNIVVNGKQQLEHTVQLKDGQGNGGTVENVSFTPVSDNHNLYFAHTEEVATLGQLLQSTFATKSDPINDWETRLSRDVAIHDPDAVGGMQKYQTYGCNTQDVRINPGDNLYGDLPKDGNQITGNLNYDATFSCKFERKTDQACVDNCKGDQTCAAACTHTNGCSKDIYVSLAIYTKTPKAQEIWDRLVDGEMSVFKKIFPKAGPNSPVESIKDIPAASKVVYTSTTDEAKAGMTGRGGAEAQLFFPHIGSLEEYFLKGIQQALRPKDVGETAIAGKPGAMCSPTNPTNKSTFRDTEISDGVIGLALQVSRYTCTPAELLIGVLSQETRGRTVTSFNPLTQEPITGDPNQKVVRTERCLNGDLNDPNGCGPYSWHPFVTYTNMAGQWQKQAADCINHFGVSSPLDQRIIAQAMCYTSAHFWGSIRLKDSSLPDCTGENQKPYTLDQVDPAGVRLATLQFCGEAENGVFTPRCQSYADTYNTMIEGYKASVGIVRDQMKACLTP
ncbi:MAG TPA: hypothetical protein VF185_02115 [Patescibacteria group bacterium]